MKCSTQRRPAMDHGKWSQQGVPQKGWLCIDFTDLEGLYGICEMCETQRIRYVHYMKHPHYDDVLGVGSDCAGKMEEDYVAAQEREKRAKSKTSRRETWMNGNPRLYRNGFVIVVSFRYGRWGYWIKERKGEQSWSKSGFASEKKAKLAAFECFDELRN